MKKCLLGLFCLFISIHSIGQTLESDRLALVAFYQATGGANWFNKTGWVVPGNPGDNPCGWFGVTCEGGRVTGLNLEQNDASGEIPAAIGGLTALKHLDLSGAGEEFPQLFGNIPVELGNLTNLEFLDLSENVMTGPNIQVIGNLTNLKHLSLTPYWTVPANFANLTNLEYLRLAANDYPMGVNTAMGAIPSFFGTFSKLKTLIISNAGAAGTIPSSLGNLTDLEVLDLSKNKLIGTIPASFNNLTKLTLLDLSENELNGPIPNILGIPIAANVKINNNAFNFSGMESNISRLDAYGNQKKFTLYGLVPLRVASASLRTAKGFSYLDAYYAGGTVANNTYKWYKSGTLIATTVGDNYLYTDEGLYRVEVTNSLVPGLTLMSNDYNFVILPVTLLSFEGKSENNQTKLTWKTTSETNNKGFEIERSADAKNFQTIGFVDGNGDTKEMKVYHFTDPAPFSNTYYRLKQIDFDGQFEYSKVVAVGKDDAIANVFPNPAQDYLIVKGTGQKQPFSIVDQNGRVAFTGFVTDRVQINLVNLGTGRYVVRVGEKSSRLLIHR